MSLGREYHDFPFRKYLATDVDADQAAPAAWSLTKPSNMIQVRGLSALRCAFYGNDTAHQDFLVTVFMVDLVDQSPSPSVYLSTQMVRIVPVLGTATGSPNTPVSASHLFADTAVVQTVAAADAANTMFLVHSDHGFGTDSAEDWDYNPADNTNLAQVTIPCKGLHGLVFVFDLDGGAATAAVSANMLWKPDQFYV